MPFRRCTGHPTGFRVTLGYSPAVGGVWSVLSAGGVCSVPSAGGVCSVPSAGFDRGARRGAGRAAGLAAAWSWPWGAAGRGATGGAVLGRLGAAGRAGALTRSLSVARGREALMPEATLVILRFSSSLRDLTRCFCIATLLRLFKLHASVHCLAYRRVAGPRPRPCLDHGSLVDSEIVHPMVFSVHRRGLAG